MLHPNQSFDASRPAATGAALAEKRPQFQTLLVPFDFSQNATALVEQLIPWAASTSADLHLIYVVEPARCLEEAEPGGKENAKDSLATASQKLLAAWARKMMRANVATQFSVKMGNPAECISRHAAQIGADLIVMSTCGYGRLKDVFSRSITEEVSARAACPVLAWPESSLRRQRTAKTEADLFPAGKRILVPTEFSESSRQALREAVAVAERNDARVLILGVISEVGQDTSVDESMAKAKIEHWARQEVPPAIEITTSVWIGMSSLYAILLEAKRSQADLIVLPSNRRSCVNRFHMAHLTDSILRHAPCPVLSIPSADSQIIEEKA